jgi:enamine deaminase RidA (YjgF/YER057c/UK114 family)
MTEIKRFLLPDEMAPVSHYCHATRAGDRVWVSGSVGVRSDGTIPEDTAEQFQVAIDTVDRCLKAAGAEARHVVKVTVLLTDINDRESDPSGILWRTSPGLDTVRGFGAGLSRNEGRDRGRGGGGELERADAFTAALQVAPDRVHGEEY